MRSGVDPLPQDPDGLMCSARDCSQPASFDLQWNNPKIHTEDRRKHWLACADHRESLGAFLSARGFLRDVEPLPQS
ncbi:MAG: acetone carboxylase [Propionibacteriaceae bacterium]